jgi:hypothetical protein
MTVGTSHSARKHGKLIRNRNGSLLEKEKEEMKEQLRVESDNRASAGKLFVQVVRLRAVPGANG